MATNGFVAGGDMLKVSVGFVGVRETLVKLAPPPFPISPFFPPQPPRAIMAQVIVKRIEVNGIAVDRVERLTLQGSCKRDKNTRVQINVPMFSLHYFPDPKPAPGGVSFVASRIFGSVALI